MVYLDDSSDEELTIYSALAISDEQWQTCLRQVREFRRELKKTDGIYVQKEFHAWKFVSGRGQIADRVVPKGRRAQIFKETLELTSRLPGARLFNVVSPTSKKPTGFEWLLNRINRTMQAWGSRAILICDQGSENEFTRMVRKMRVYNPIPSKYGNWLDSGSSTKNIPIERIVEDPFFKDSAQSYFVQITDFCAYALLRRERPLASKSKYGLDKAFDLLKPILVLETNPQDSEGIIRIK